MHMDLYDRNVSREQLDRIRKHISLAYEFKAHNSKMLVLKPTDQFNLYAETLRSDFVDLYSRFGLKTIVALIEEPLTYSRLRRMFSELNIEFQKRTCTDDLRRLRSINAKKSERLRDWTNKFKQPDRGIQGYYKNRSGELVWLRSSWEYAYAKYLDDTNVDWKFEVRNYLLADGSTYRPDFFIYENDKLVEVVEVKSFYFETAQKRVEKAKRASNEFGFRLKIVGETELREICNLRKSLREWKSTRILSKEI